MRAKALPFPTLAATAIGLACALAVLACGSGARASAAPAAPRAAVPARSGPSAAGDDMSGMAGYPDLMRATRAQIRQARRLWRATLASARKRFPTYAAARAAGYRPLRRTWKRPLVFHLRSRVAERDGARLDPRAPEALVYWWPVGGRPVLLAFMYRVPAGRPPALGGPIIHYHSHVSRRGRAATQMTHVWLTRGLRSAYARCLPVAALERAIPAFHYTIPANHPTTGSTACKETMTR
jgi:hypothetical protein